LEALRHCLPPSVRRTLRELPESLDETYERILKEIKKPNRGHARRVLECLVVAIRPLRVGELAEVLAVDFDDAEGMPKLNADWRWEDQEHALLIACSSLITIVKDGDSRVVQFSHFSVKEFLTSSRLATASGEASDYHIDLKPAHTTLAQACLGVLLRIHDDVEGHTPEDHPLAEYAARHCTTHAQFEDAPSRLQKGMEYLFDPDKPHFEAWHTLYDIDTEPRGPATFFLFTPSKKSVAAPLYYAALCGFHDLVEHLIIKHPQDVNAGGGYYLRPLLAALAGKHFQTAELLRHNGASYADLHNLGYNLFTPLHSAAYYGDLEMVQKLIEYDVNISAKSSDGRTPLHLASGDRGTKDLSVPRPSIFRLLLERGADVNAQAKSGSTPLHSASIFATPEVVRVLLEHGANVKAEDNNGRTALQVAERDEGGFGNRDEVMKLLLEHESK
jgi:Ankyrin repeats (3 copies)/Ankyrin repeat